MLAAVAVDDGRQRMRKIEVVGCGCWILNRKMKERRYGERFVLLERFAGDLWW